MEYVDRSISAHSGKKRPQYELMLEAVREGEVDRIVIWHTDRLYRRPRELEDLVDLAEKGRVSIHSVSGGEMDLSRADGRLVARMFIAVAAHESENKSRRVRRAKQQARELGLMNGGPRPFGWRASPVMNEDGEPVINRDGTPRVSWNIQDIDPNEARVIREAVDDVLAGVSLNEITRRWNAAGITQPRSGRSEWTADIVRTILATPRIAGFVTYRPLRDSSTGSRYYGPPQKFGKGTWPAIVDPARWEQLQALLAYRASRYRVPRRRSLLGGVLRCGRCGAKLRRATAPDKSNPKRRVFKCVDKMQGGCSGVAIDAAGLEALVVQMALQRCETVDLFRLIDEDQGVENGELQALSEEVENLDAREAELGTSYGKGLLNIHAFEAASRELDAKRAEVTSRLGRISSKFVAVPYATADAEALRRDWPKLTMDQQREIIGLLLGTIVINPAVPGRQRFDPDRVSVEAPTVTVRRRKPGQHKFRELTPTTSE
jgi:DNA invertase Pin-like site-specific DNA recombinase